ncbi:MAG: transposase [Planctomycetota bacterium]
MPRMRAYMVTWTTYGSWLQGDRRGYVKAGKVLAGDEALREANLKKLKSNVVKLSRREQQIVRDAILLKAASMGQEIYAMAVCSNHVHIVAERIAESIEMVVSRYKNAARLALRKNGFVTRVWTRGFDKRFCFNGQQLKRRIEYVQAHQKQPV